MLPQPDCGNVFLPPPKIIEGLSRVFDAVENVVVVWDYIYCDAMHFDPLVDDYRRFLAQIDRAVAEKCDVVLEAVYANIIAHKGKVSYETLAYGVLHGAGDVPGYYCPRGEREL